MGPTAKLPAEARAASKSACEAPQHKLEAKREAPQHNTHAPGVAASPQQGPCRARTALHITLAQPAFQQCSSRAGSLALAAVWSELPLQHCASGGSGTLLRAAAPSAPHLQLPAARLRHRQTLAQLEELTRLLTDLRGRKKRKKVKGAPASRSHRGTCGADRTGMNRHVPAPARCSEAMRCLMGRWTTRDSRRAARVRARRRHGRPGHAGGPHQSGHAGCGCGVGRGRGPQRWAARAARRRRRGGGLRQQRAAANVQAQRAGLRAPGGGGGTRREPPQSMPGSQGPQRTARDVRAPQPTHFPSRALLSGAQGWPIRSIRDNSIRYDFIRIGQPCLSPSGPSPPRAPQPRPPSRACVRAPSACTADASRSSCSRRRPSSARSSARPARSAAAAAVTVCRRAVVCEGAGWGGAGECGGAAVGSGTWPQLTPLSLPWTYPRRLASRTCHTSWLASTHHTYHITHHITHITHITSTRHQPTSSRSPKRPSAATSSAAARAASASASCRAAASRRSRRAASFARRCSARSRWAASSSALRGRTQEGRGKDRA